MGRILSLFSTEYDLVKAINRGDQRAYHSFYEKYSAQFLGICYRYINDRMAAEDVMVESMMRIFEKSNQFNFKGSFEGWCKRLVVNQALNYLRNHSRIAFDLDEVTEIAQEVQNDLETAELLNMLAELPDGYRMVFNLFAIEGYSHTEIAALLGITEGTSKSQLSRARSLLQKRFIENHEIVKRYE